MKANCHQFSPRSGVVGASAMPSAPVVPRQKVLLSTRTSDTLAPATGAPVSRRVTKIRVFCGLSLTEMPRLVTWMTEARVRASPASPDRCARGMASPSFTAAHTSPLPFGFSAFDMSRPCDWIRSAVTPRRRAVPSPAGALVKFSFCSRTSVGIRSAGWIGAAHCVTSL